MAIIEMKQVTKDYPLGDTTVHALRGVDFSVEEGEFLSIVGPSGSGKTTMLNIIGLIDHATAGSVRVSGKEVTTMTDSELTDLRLYTIGFIFQTFNLIPVLNILENVEFPLLLMKSLSKAEVRKRAEYFIEEVGLTPYLTHKPAELSGGQRQRVAIARALVTKPKIILADEPTANLDTVTSNEILALMQELNKIEKTTFIFSTHDPEVLQYAQKVVKIRDGVITESGAAH
ncbi:MAG: ABC transporter ATP-binding protein [Spirochaetes bacterium]|nr:ABC transporter ATP-binding protein [Spirochaetota bacterium]